MRILRSASIVVFVIACVSLSVAAQDGSQGGNTSATTATAPNLSAASSFDQVIDRMVERERAFNEQMRGLQPLIETYIQTLNTDPEMGLVPANDVYFLGRLDLKN